MVETVFFADHGARRTHSSRFDEDLARAGDALVAAYLWGENCFNCEQFKKAASLHRSGLQALQLHWLEADVYADPALGQRFGLHGVPAFVFFHRQRKLGRISGWPGWPAFEQAVLGLRQQIETASCGTKKA